MKVTKPLIGGKLPHMHLTVTLSFNMVLFFSCAACSGEVYMVIDRVMTCGPLWPVCCLDTYMCCCVSLLICCLFACLAFMPALLCVP